MHARIVCVDAAPTLPLSRSPLTQRVRPFLLRVVSPAPAPPHPSVVRVCVQTLRLRSPLFEVAIKAALSLACGCCTLALVRMRAVVVRPWLATISSSAPPWPRSHAATAPRRHRFHCV